MPLLSSLSSPGSAPGALLSSALAPHLSPTGVKSSQSHMAYPRTSRGPHRGQCGRRLWVVSASCAVSTSSSCPVRKGAGRGCWGPWGRKEARFPLAGGARGYQGAAWRLLPFPRDVRTTRFPPLAGVCRSGGAGGCAAGVPAPAETGRPAGGSGKHLWVPALTGALGWTQQNQNCCVTAAAVAGVTGEFPTLPPGCGCRRGGALCAPGAMGPRDHRPPPCPLRPRRGGLLTWTPTPFPCLL